MTGLHGGVGHSGGIGTYISHDYINEEYGYNMIISINSMNPHKMQDFINELLYNIT